MGSSIVMHQNHRWIIKEEIGLFENLSENSEVKVDDQDY